MSSTGSHTSVFSEADNNAGRLVWGVPASLRKRCGAATICGPGNAGISGDGPSDSEVNWIYTAQLCFGQQKLATASKEKARVYFLSARLQLPREGSKADNKNLLTESDVVNRKARQFYSEATCFDFSRLPPAGQVAAVGAALFRNPEVVIEGVVSSP